MPARSNSTASRGSIDIVQVRTRAITGLPEQYRGIVLEISSRHESLKSSAWTRQPEGVFACEFWARLPYPEDGIIDIKVSATAPWRTPQLRYYGPARSQFAFLDLRADAADATEAQEGRYVPGVVGAVWRSLELPLGHRDLVDRLRGRKHCQPEAKLQVDYCLLSLPPSLSRLPELDLLEPLARPLHSYAHGGFMGAALSLLADPQWATLLLAITGEEDDKMQSHISEIAGLQREDVLTAQSRMLPLMLVLENSPVLCAFGLVRSGCTKPPEEAARTAGATAPLVAPPPYAWQAFGLPHNELPRMLQSILGPQLHQNHNLGNNPEQDSSGSPQPQSLQPAFNRYGYAPLGLEWDLWLSPDQPADLAAAVVDHGSAGDLVQQAIAMALRCDAVAKHMGRRHNRSQGISPMRWLVDFATALNQGVNGREYVPLPLWGRPPPPHEQQQQAGQAAATTASGDDGSGGDAAGVTDALVPYSDGRACPSLERYLRLRLESLAVRAPPPRSRESLQASRLTCRVRLVGNTHTHDVVWLNKFVEVEEPPPRPPTPPSPSAQQQQQQQPAPVLQTAKVPSLQQLGSGRPGEGGVEASSPSASPGTAAAGTAKEGAEAPAAAAPPPSAKLHVSAELRGSTAAVPPLEVEGKDACWYPVETADLGRSLLVVEIYTGYPANTPVARVVAPLSVLASSPSGGLTFTAPMHHRKSAGAMSGPSGPENVPPSPPAASGPRPAPVAEGQLECDGNGGDGAAAAEGDDDGAAAGAVQRQHSSRQLRKPRELGVGPASVESCGSLKSSGSVVPTGDWQHERRRPQQHHHQDHQRRQQQQQQQRWRRRRGGPSGADDLPAPEPQCMERGDDDDPWVRPASPSVVVVVDGGGGVPDREPATAHHHYHHHSSHVAGAWGGGTTAAGPVAESPEGQSQLTSTSSHSTSRISAALQRFSSAARADMHSRLGWRSSSRARSARVAVEAAVRGDDGAAAAAAAAARRPPPTQGMATLTRFGTATRAGMDMFEMEMREMFQRESLEGSEQGDDADHGLAEDVYDGDINEDDEGDEDDDAEFEVADEDAAGWGLGGEEREEGAGKGEAGGATEWVEDGAAAARVLHIADVLVSEDPAQALSYRHRLAAAGRGAMSLTLRWDTLTVLEAAQQLYGLPLHVTQSCTAMLSAPGGLFLDIKSGYSRSKHLRSFASTLAGVGIHVKAICSFVPKQIDFGDNKPHAEDHVPEVPGRSNPTAPANIPADPDASGGTAAPTTAAVMAAASSAPGEPPPGAMQTQQPTQQPTQQQQPTYHHHDHRTYLKWVSGKLPGPAPRTFDSVLFFHGLNGLELACEAGRVPPGTCVLFNGASMLLEDPGRAVVPPSTEGSRLSTPGSVTASKAGPSQTGQAAAVRAAPPADNAADGPAEAGAAPPPHLVVEEDPAAGPTAKAAPDAAPEATATATAGAGAGPVGEAVEEEQAAAVASSPSSSSSSAAAAAAGTADIVMPAAAEAAPPATEQEGGVGGARVRSSLPAAVPNPPVEEEAEAATATAGCSPQPGVGVRGASGRGGFDGAEDLPALVDKEAWRRYCTVVSMFKVYGGIYVQEPDCCPAALDALIRLTNRNPGYLPLGFAYGHMGDKAVAVAGYMGRGMAAQQLLEELSSRRALSNKVRKWINQGVHVGASDQVYLSWGRRVLTSTELLYLGGQVLLLRLLADYDSGVPGGLLAEGAALLYLVNGMGGFRFIFLRFFKHYEAESALTFLEMGFNTNYTKALLRLLRNRGALAAMQPGEKAQTAVWLVSGRDARLWVERCCLRGGKHKFVKEALACLVESCTQDEFKQICAALGGVKALERAVMGWTHVFGWHYRRRIRAAERFWADGHADTSLIAAGACTYGFIRYARRLPGGDIAPGQGLEVEEEEAAADKGGKEGPGQPDKGKAKRRRWRRLPREWLGPDGVMVTTDPRHTRDKAWMFKLWRLARKWSCCACTWATHCAICCTCGFCYTLFLCPVLCYPYCRSRLLPFLVAVVLVVFWILIVAGAIGAARAVASHSSSHPVDNSTATGNTTLAPPYYAPVPF